MERLDIKQPSNFGPLVISLNDQQNFVIAQGTDVVVLSPGDVRKLKITLTRLQKVLDIKAEMDDMIKLTQDTKNLKGDDNE